MILGDIRVHDAAKLVIDLRLFVQRMPMPHTTRP